MIASIVHASMLLEFILEAIVLIIVAECYIYTALLYFLIDFGSMPVFIIIKALDNLIFFIK